MFGYDEFGSQFGTTSCVKQPFGFTGYCTDDLNITRTLFAQARQYDSMTGRFISEDSIKGFAEAPFTLNQYTYVWNNPLNLLDLNGLYPELPYGHLDPAIYCQETGFVHGATVPIGSNVDFGRELRAIRDWFGNRWNDAHSWYNNWFGNLPDWRSASLSDWGNVTQSTLRDAVRTPANVVNTVYCNITIEGELGVGFQWGKEVNDFQLEIGASSSDRLSFNGANGFQFTRNVRQIGAQAIHEQSGFGLSVIGTYTDEEGARWDFGPRQNNLEVGLIDDRRLRFGMSKYFLIGGGFSIEANLSGIRRHWNENDDFWQACE